MEQRQRNNKIKFHLGDCTDEALRLVLTYCSFIQACQLT